MGIEICPSNATNAQPILRATASVEAPYWHLHSPLPASKAVLSSWRLVVVCALITTGVTGLASKYPAGTYALTHLVFFFVPMFSGWHKSEEANYGTGFMAIFPSYAIGYGSHAPPFFLAFMLI